MDWWYSRVAGLVARGYQPPAKRRPSIDWVIPAPVDEGRLVVFCPTVTVARNERSQAEAILQFAAHLWRGLERGALPPCLLLLGVHHTSDRRDVAITRVYALRERLASAPFPFAAFCTTEAGKVTALNVAIALAVRSRAIGLLQLDDDIRLEEHAVEELYAAYRAAGRGIAVGAAKVAVPRSTSTSRVMQWSKRRTRTAVNYPHACCLLFDPRLLAPGVPARYVSDDGYICFKLLRPEFEDPLVLLRLVPDARCFYHVGGPAHQAVRRVRGILLSVHIFLADFPPQVSRYYFREILFPGFWPLGSRPSSQPLNWLVQSLYFAWFTAVGLELAVRGAVGIPLRDIGWAPVQDRALPTAIEAGIP